MLLTHTRRGGRDAAVGAGAPGPRRLRGVPRVPHARQPRLPPRLPHAPLRALRPTLPRAHPSPCQPPTGVSHPPTSLPGRAAFPVVRSDDRIPRRLSGAAPDFVRVPPVLRFAPPSPKPGGVVPGVLAPSDPPPAHAGEPHHASRVHHLAVEPSRATLASHM